MTGKSQQVDVVIDDVDGKHADGLRSVEKKFNVVFASDFAHRGGGLNGSQHIAGVRECDQPCFGRDGFFDFVRINHAGLGKNSTGSA